MFTPLSFSSQYEKVLDFLLCDPSTEEVARAIALDFLREFSLTRVCITALKTEPNSSQCIAQYVADQALLNVISMPEDIAWVPLNFVNSKPLNDHLGTDADHSTFGIKLRVRNTYVGCLLLQTSTPLDAVQFEALDKALYEITKLISLYFFSGPRISFTNNTVVNYETTNNHLPLTKRQLEILRRMTEGQTNAVIARGLGFSISTVRHETMRIYEKLGVSDRREAASKASATGLIAV